MPKVRRGDSVQSCGGLISRLAYARALPHVGDMRDLLRRAGLDLADIENSNARFSVASQIKFVELIADAIPDPELGVHLAQDLDLRRLEFLYYVPASADTLGTALRRLERYSSLANEGIHLRVKKGKTVRVRFQYVGVARHTDRHQIEFFITAIIRICHQLVARTFKLLAVRVAHHRSATQGDLKKFATVEIDQDAGVDEIEFPSECLDLPVVTTDPHLHNLLVRYCEDALARRETKGGPLRSRVENTLAELLPHGPAQVGTVAGKLGMSPRTLSRRLAAEALSFSNIVRELRIALAHRYLTDPELRISQIAWLLGYQEVGAFTHAFRRWTGKTPSKARMRLAD
jgi:AraC-like DNA-binding protein